MAPFAHTTAMVGNDLLKHLDGKTPILIDSGGQYEYGTTDITRTWHFEEDAGAEFRDVNTRVLKGHIGLDTLIFPGESFCRRRPCLVSSELCVDR